VIANALKMSRSDARYDRIPALGENNAAILGELGYDAAAIESLKRDKVI
jgi:crotonobetainyl-CoA:carnitine CoA-transferase CaiB-like acyl-CoA transferase